MMKDGNTKVIAEASKLKWASRLESIISLLGYSIGLSEIWRVPYLTYRNGGGAFLIPYIFFMSACGIPLYFLEVMLSQFSGKGTWRVWDFCPLFRGFGIAFLVLNWISATYNMINKTWMIEYIIASFSSELPWSSCDNEWNTPGCIQSGHVMTDITINATSNSAYNDTTDFPENLTTKAERYGKNVVLMSSVEEFWSYKILDISTGIDDVGSMNWKYVLYMLACNVIIWFSLVRSVKSIGKMMYVTALAPVLLTIIIWIRSLMLPGATSGMAYFITPDFYRLAHTEVWIEAAFMAFHTLGPAWGGLPMYGSHNKFHDSCFRDSVMSTVLTVLYGLFNGLVLFSVLGVLAHETGIPLDKAISSGGLSLGFVAYPQAITYFPVPQVWAVLFFIVLLLPALDTQTISMEPVLCVIEENFPKTVGRRRIPLLTALTVVIFICALPFATQGGIYMFQLIDWYSVSWSVLFIAVTESILFAWVYGGDRLSRDMHLMLGRQLPVFIRTSTAFITPVVLAFLVIVSIFKYKPPTYGTYTYPEYARAIGWCFALSSIVPIFIYMVWILKRQQGSLHQRFACLLHPLPEWLPSKDKLIPIYRHSETKYNWSFKRLVKFNITGRGGYHIMDNLSEFEMEPISESEDI